MLGTGEMIVILCVVLILFGGKKLPEFARHLGQGIREFKKACQGLDDEVSETKPQAHQKPAETFAVEVQREDDHRKN